MLLARTKNEVVRSLLMSTDAGTLSPVSVALPTIPLDTCNLNFHRLHAAHAFFIMGY